LLLFCVIALGVNVLRGPLNVTLPLLFTQRLVNSRPKKLSPSWKIDVIPTLINQNPWAQSRFPIDLMRHG